MDLKASIKKHWPLWLLALFIVLTLTLFLARGADAQKPGDISRLSLASMKVDSVVNSRVHYTFTAHEDSVRVGSKGSMAQGDWLTHTFLVTPAPVLGDAANGLIVWRAECQECHTGREADDLAHFKFPRADIMARAMLHVTEQEAADIVAHVESLATADTMQPLKIPYQPGGVVLPSDSAFGVKLFGVDQWPANVTRDSLLKINARHTPIALPLPVWSDKLSPYDWLPGSIAADEGQLPAGVLAASSSQLAAYYANPTLSNAMTAQRRIRTVAHDASIADAPCTYESAPSRYDAQACADLGKWTATFLYVHMIKAGTLHTDVTTATDSWWETAHLFHKAQQHGKDIPLRSQQICGWMWLGWMFDYALGKHTLYAAGPCGDIGLTRMATFHTLLTQVHRGATGLSSSLACYDAQHLANFGHVPWMLNQMTQVYDELLFRDANNMIPAGYKNNCIAAVNTAQTNVRRRAGDAMKAQLQPKADAVIAALSN